MRDSYINNNVEINVIDELRSINLTDYTAADKVKSCFDKLQIIVLPIIDIDKGFRIYRATNIGEDEEISSVERLSYKPECLNTTYQRASIPGGTAFYGTYDPYQCECPKINRNGIVSSIYEVCPLIRQAFVPNQTATVVVSEWQVMKYVSLFALAATDGSNYSAFLNRIGSDLIPFLRQKGLCDGDISRLNDFQKYMTDRYTLKVDESNSHEYIISALFAEKIKKECRETKGIDGLIWHSNLAVDSKLDDTLALALFPESVSDKLHFARCFKCLVTSSMSDISVGRPMDITNSIIDIEK